MVIKTEGNRVGQHRLPGPKSLLETSFNQGPIGLLFLFILSTGLHTDPPSTLWKKPNQAGSKKRSAMGKGDHMHDFEILPQSLELAIKKSPHETRRWVLRCGCWRDDPLLPEWPVACSRSIVQRFWWMGNRRREVLKPLPGNPKGKICHGSTESERTHPNGRPAWRLCGCHLISGRG